MDALCFLDGHLTFGVLWHEDIDVLVCRRGDSDVGASVLTRLLLDELLFRRGFIVFVIVIFFSDLAMACGTGTVACVQCVYDLAESFN